MLDFERFKADHYALKSILDSIEKEKSKEF